MMTPEEKAAFVLRGRNILTSFAIHADQLGEWKEAFDARGGAAELGQDALDIVSFVANPVIDLVENDATMQTIIAKFRTDY